MWAASSPSCGPSRPPFRRPHSHQPASSRPPARGCPAPRGAPAAVLPRPWPPGGVPGRPIPRRWES
eukprot:7917302-Lingulodinium_polyedra.AAC.1